MHHRIQFRLIPHQPAIRTTSACPVTNHGGGALSVSTVAAAAQPARGLLCCPSTSLLKEKYQVATRIERIVVDDFDASTDGVGTYRFALEGVEYEIDLSQANLQRLRTVLAPFITAGRRLPKHKTSKTAAAKPTQTGKVRRWWSEHEQTHQLPGWRANGPIPHQVYDAYANAHPASTR
ncbi:Lsr2 family protein [Dactylosporangium sp. NPDC048998]|uniref:histone-like nucleoid-structuring protein Lsr2 n=1 Tax=Dactylosporangium sp. NPDC048998 TaxID=3363976 RepID=UPI00371B803C